MSKEDLRIKIMSTEGQKILLKTKTLEANPLNTKSQEGLNIF